MSLITLIISYLWKTRKPVVKEAAPMHKGIVRVKDDSERLKMELEALKDKNPGLRALIFDLADWIKETLNKETVITMIFRTEAEQDEIYKDDPRHKVKKRVSPHQLWHSADLRSSIFTAEEIEKIVVWINTNYNKTNYYAETAMYHKVGTGALHFHIQWVSKV